MAGVDARDDRPRQRARIVIERHLENRERTREARPAERCPPAPKSPPIGPKPVVPKGDQPNRPAPKMPSGTATANSPLMPVKAAPASATTPPAILTARASTTGLAARNICSSK